jgi:hypothetical protein
MLLTSFGNFLSSAFRPSSEDGRYGKEDEVMGKKMTWMIWILFVLIQPLWVTITWTGDWGTSIKL